MNCSTYERIHTLTRREREVMDLLAEGLSNEQIAGQMAICERTVRTYCSTIMQKLRLTNRTEIAVQTWRRRVAELEAENARLRAQLANPNIDALPQLMRRACQDALRDAGFEAE